MNQNKQGEKYVPTPALNNVPFSFDAEKFGNKSETELTELILDRIPLICQDFWSRELKIQEKENQQKLLHSYSMNEAYQLITSNDAKTLVYLNDFDNDARLNEKEFDNAVRQMLFDLAFEAILQSEDELAHYYTESQVSIENELETLFPNETSTLGKEDIRRMIIKIDSDGDNKTTRQEIYDQFKAN